MEYSKEQKLQLKAAIKSLSDAQRSVKSQRKTVHFKGERTIPAWKAVATHSINRYDLRHMYIAYGIMRGKTIEQIEPKRKSEFSQSKVDKILENYGQAICDNQK